MSFYHDRPEVRFAETLAPGTFRQRLTRFSASADIDGQSTVVHVANTGRLQELLTAGAAIWLRPAAKTGRRTHWDLALVEHRGLLVSVDSRLPNRLAARALAEGRIEGFTQYDAVRAEATVGGSRFDFQLSLGPHRCLVEVKGVTLVVAGRSLFPDAPTTRGARHLRELGRFVAHGCGSAAVIFIVQRSDALEFAPNEPADPAFALALRTAAASGVQVRAFRCSVSTDGVALADEIPARL